MDAIKQKVQDLGDKVSGKNKHGKGLILATGATSYIAAHVIRLFLDAGYFVRGQVRNDASIEKVTSIFPAAAAEGTLTTVVVPDIQAPGAFDDAVRNVDGVIHMASPFVFAVKDNKADLLDPAILGTTRLLEAVDANAPQVTRVVITSSFAAMVDPMQGLRPGYTYTEKDWNPTTYDAAVATELGPVAYCASKAFAEKAAWDFVEQRKPNFTVSTICPPMVYGPAEHAVGDLSKLNTSVADIYRFMNGSESAPGDTAFPAFVDVRDVGEAHLRAYERDQSGRFFVVGGTFEYPEVCRVLRETLPDRHDKIPDPAATPKIEAKYEVDNSQTAKALDMTFRSLDESIRDTAKSLVALEQGKTWKEVSGSA